MKKSTNETEISEISRFTAIDGKAARYNLAEVNFYWECLVKYQIRTLATLAMSLALTGLSQAQNTRIACDDPAYQKRDTVAELRELTGNVLVSDAAGVGTAAGGQRIANKARVTTASKAGVVVSFDCGCDVKLAENQRFDIDVPRACSGLLAAVQPVPTAVALGATAAPAIAAPSTATLLTVGAVGVGGYVIYRNNRNVSPN